MAFELHRYAGFPGIAASAIPPRSAVAFAAAGERGVIPVASTNVEPFGVTHNTATIPAGEAIAVHENQAVVKAVAAASLGMGAVVGPAAASGGFAVASAGFRTGIAQSAAAPGEVFSFYVAIRGL